MYGMLIFSLYLRPLESDDILLIMHRILLHRAQKAIRFLRWSRKAYAAFCSLHRNVTIGQVGKGIADASLSKAKEVVQVCHVSEVRPVVPDSGGTDSCVGWTVPAGCAMSFRQLIVLLKGIVWGCPCPKENVVLFVSHFPGGSLKAFVVPGFPVVTGSRLEGQMPFLFYRLPI